LTASTVLAASLFAIGVSLIVFANVVFYAILGEVNGKLPPDQQIRLIGVNVKYARVLHLHSDLYPQSKKRGHLKLLLWGGFLTIATALVANGLHLSRW